MDITEVNINFYKLILCCVCYLGRRCTSVYEMWFFYEN